MGNLIMPKQTSELSRMILTLEILLDNHNMGKSVVPNSLYKSELINRLPNVFDSNSDGPMMVKQSEIARYFGFAHRDFAKKTQIITERGIEFYNAYVNNSKTIQLDLLAKSILEDTFGRGNTAIKQSDSDIDPPKLFIYSIVALSGLAKDELALLIYLTHDCQLSEQSALGEIVQYRLNKCTSIVIPKIKTNKYSDTKFPAFLVEVGFCLLDDNKRYQLVPEVKTRYRTQFELMSVYNQTPLVTKLLETEDDSNSDILETDQSTIYREQVHKTLEYDTTSSTFLEQNSRKPKLKKQSLSGRKYSTNPRLAKTALKLSDYLCELDNHHITFLNKADNPFMEPHHFVPMAAQGDIEQNLDCIENIVSLCPNCHSAIHYGNDDVRYHIVKQLYGQREDTLDKAKINLSLDELLEKYYN